MRNQTATGVINRAAAAAAADLLPPTDLPEVAAAGWVQAATNDPFFSHARVTGPDATLPTGGNRTNMVANYAMVLGYLAGHGAWDHFTTVLTRGVMVSEAEDQDA